MTLHNFLNHINMDSKNYVACHLAKTAIFHKKKKIFLGKKSGSFKIIILPFPRVFQLTLVSSCTSNV